VEGAGVVGGLGEVVAVVRGAGIAAAEGVDVAAEKGMVEEQQHVNSDAEQGQPDYQHQQQQQPAPYH
jgi:hypothetical protein